MGLPAKEFWLSKIARLIWIQGTQGATGYSALIIFSN
jgi:hypothetical protein